ncbi:MAG: hypothetical protein ABIY51_12055 [Ferruginibacter sp.]
MESIEAQSPQFITIPIAISTTKDKYDSSFFYVTIAKKGFKVDLHGQKKYLKTAHLLDRFIYTHKIQIDKNKISVSAVKNYPIESFNDLKEVFKQHGYLKFKIP